MSMASRPSALFGGLAAIVDQMPKNSLAIVWRLYYLSGGKLQYTVFCTFNGSVAAGNVL